MILEQQGNIWCATFTRNPKGVPRVEVFHKDHRNAYAIGHACERLLEKKFPKDFPGEQKSLGDKAVVALLACLGVSLVAANLLTGVATVAQAF